MTMVMAAMVVVMAMAVVPVNAQDGIDFPASYGYTCVSNRCEYTTATADYDNAVECTEKCGNGAGADEAGDLNNETAIVVGTDVNGTCYDCSMKVTTQFYFPELFATFSLTPKSVAAEACNFKAQMVVSLPPLWSFDSADSDCLLGDIAVACTHFNEPGKNDTLLSLNAEAVQKLMVAPSANESRGRGRMLANATDSVTEERAAADSNTGYTVLINQVSSRQSSRKFDDKTELTFQFYGKGCVEGGGTDEEQGFSVDLTASSYMLTGMFTNTSMVATNQQADSVTAVEIRFDSGAVLTAGCVILIRVAGDLEERFGALIQDVDNARLVSENHAESPLELTIGDGNLSFVIPDNFVGYINNGESAAIKFDNFRNPADMNVNISKVWLSAFRDKDLAVNNSIVLFYPIQPVARVLKAAPLDIASVVVFGVCFLFSLVIIRWHGLPLTMTTLWTDMVAISSLFSFATGAGCYLVWTIQPSKAYVYWYAAQYFFNTVMVLSLCFHWSAVLAFKAFKKLTLTSPVVIAYVTTIVAVLAFILVCCVHETEKLTCVFETTAPYCSSANDCEENLAASGRLIRHIATHTCHMQNFYLAFGIGFVTYTVMLMVLGCMVMRRGRSLMLNEDPSDSRIRQSLTIFYIIIATTIVLYISAQVIYIAQYVSNGEDSNELSDLVWYIFIVWLPQGLPPMLLLFLQWNPRTETLHPEEPQESIDIRSSKDDVFNMTPRSSGSSPNLHYSKLFRTSMADSMLNNDDPGNKLRLIVRLKLPASFDRACFVSLDFCTSKVSFSHDASIRQITRSANWKCVGTTEPVGVGGETEAVVMNGVSQAIFPFVAVLEVPVVGAASNTLLRFLVHTTTIGGQRDHRRGGSNNMLDSQGSGASDSSNHGDSQLSYQMTMFQPMFEFVTTSQAVLDAAASGQPLNIHPSDDQTCTVLHDATPAAQSEVQTLLLGNMNNAELSVQTVMMPGEDPTKEDQAHKNIGNIIRFFQYDSEDGGGGLVVEDLQESNYANAIPRQLIELIAVERQDQVDKAREDLHSFLNQKKDKQNRGFYGTLIGQIQDEGDTAIAKEWLEARLRKRKEYVALVRKNIQYLVNRDKHKLYFKASVEKKSSDLRFVPINLHIQDLLIGPTKSFINEEKRRASKEVSTYDFTTVGAPAAHCYKFNKGGILSFQEKLKKMQAKMAETELDLSKWPEEVRDYDDLQWDLQLRMDSCLAQAMAALTASLVRKVEVAIQNADIVKGEDMLRQLSTLGFLFQVESLLSTHGKEIGMLEDMAGAVAQLSCVAFVIQDVRDKPSNRFSFRMSRKKDVNDDAAIVKVSVSQKSARDVKRTHVKYVVTVQVYTAEVELPDRLAAGGEISVTPVLFTQGINEMQTIANNTERAKTELQDMININNLRPLKQFCEKYCRLAVALPSMNQGVGRFSRASHRGYKTMNQAPMRLTEDQVSSEFRALETIILDAAQSLVKTKHPEILQRTSDLCRELGGGRVTVCKSAKDRTAMSVTLEQVRILHRHHDLPQHRVPATVSVMRSHGVRIENALKNTGKRLYAFNKLQRSLLPEEYRCPDQVGGTGNVS